MLKLTGKKLTALAAAARNSGNLRNRFRSSFHCGRRAVHGS